MNKEERVKLVFETISKIVGFEIKPEKEFRIVGNGIKTIYKINEDLYLYCKTPNGYYRVMDYSVLSIFRGEYHPKEIKEPLLTDEEEKFLKQFKFNGLSVVLNFLNMYDEKGALANVINLNVINFSFDGLKEGRTYSAKELGL